MGLHFWCSYKRDSCVSMEIKCLEFAVESWEKSRINRSACPISSRRQWSTRKACGNQGCLASKVKNYSSYKCSFNRGVFLWQRTDTVEKFLWCLPAGRQPATRPIIFPAISTTRGREKKRKRLDYRTQKNAGKRTRECLASGDNLFISR